MIYFMVKVCSLCKWCFKSSFFYLCNWAKENSIKIIDCQVYNKHLESLGAYEISREEFFLKS